MCAGMCAQVRGQLDVLCGACKQLTSCGDFMALLQAVLTLGNHLNEGTMRGAASGAPTALAQPSGPSRDNMCQELLVDCVVW